MQIPLANGGSVGSLNTGEEGNHDVEQVPREMKGKEAIKITDLYKSFHVSTFLTAIQYFSDVTIFLIF